MAETERAGRFAAQTLAIAAAHLPDALLTPSLRGALQAVADYIAPGQQLYFECRLAGADQAIDVSQHFFAHAGGAPALLALAEKLYAIAEVGSSAWQALAGFARRWRDEKGFSDSLVEIGLEHDLGEDGRWVEAPAIFAAFRTDVLTDRAAAAHFIETTVPNAEPAWRNLIAALEIAQAHGLRSGRMIGAMLSRDDQLRCMIRDLSLEAVRDLLAALGWRGDVERLCSLLAEPVLASAATRLVLGFSPTVVPDIGLEIIPSHDGASLAGLEPVLAWACATGLADRKRVSALSVWPDRIDPINARADWPDAMIAHDLAGRPGSPHWNCFVNHVKLNLPAGRPLAPVKAYLSLAPMPAGGYHHV